MKFVPVRPLFVFLALASVIGWLYVLFISDLFVLRKIQVQGTRALDSVDVEREVYIILDARKEWKPWSPRHTWFINTTELANELKDRLFAASVTVDKTYSGILRLMVEERSNKLILHSGQQFLWVDLQGVVTNELSMNEENKLLTQGKNFYTLDRQDSAIFYLKKVSNSPNIETAGEANFFLGLACLRNKDKTNAIKYFESTAHTDNQYRTLAEKQLKAIK